MSIDFYNKLRTFFIQNEYKFLSTYLKTMQSHINFLNDYNMVSLYERNLFIGKIYECIKNLNNKYNEEIINDEKEITNKISNVIDLEYLEKNFNMDECYSYLTKINLVEKKLPNKNLLNFLEI